MSGQVTGWVYRHGPHPKHVGRDGEPYGSRARALRSVLLTIADAANRDGHHARPGIAAMVEGSLYAKSYVSNVVAKLVEDGWLEIEEQGNGRGHATVYRVVLETPHSVGGSSDQQTSHPVGGSAEVNLPLQEAKPPTMGAETSHYGGSVPLSPTVKNNGNEQRGESVLAFDDFWAVFPRREEKREAHKAWAAACKVASAEVIIEGARRYRDDPNRMPAYTKLPTTWLNRGCWDDEPLPPRVGVSTTNGYVNGHGDPVGVASLREFRRRRDG